MYSFGREVRDLKEAENVFAEKIDEGLFDDFLEENRLSMIRDSIISHIKCDESYVLGIDDDIDLEDLFDINKQQAIIEEIKTREGYADSSLIIGDNVFNIESGNKSLYYYFVASHAFSCSNNDKILLLSIGFLLYDDNYSVIGRKFITV